MAKYVVIPIALLGSNNVMLKAGDIKEENSFNRPVAELVNEGFVRKATADDIKAEKEASEGDKNKVSENDKLAAKASAEAAKKAEDEAKKAQEEADKAAKKATEEANKLADKKDGDSGQK